MLGIGKIIAFSSKNLSKVKKEVGSALGYYGGAVKQGWMNGERLADMRRLNSIGTFSTKVKGVGNKLKKTEFRTEDLPAILGSIGTVTPLPLGTFVGYGVGKLINIIR